MNRVFFRNVRHEPLVESLGKVPTAMDIRNYPGDKYKHDRWAFMPDPIDGHVIYLVPATGAFKPQTATIKDNTITFDDPEDNIPDSVKRHVRDLLAAGKKIIANWDVYGGEGGSGTGDVDQHEFSIPDSDDEAPERSLHSMPKHSASTWASLNASARQQTRVRPPSTPLTSTRTPVRNRLSIVQGSAHRYMSDLVQNTRRGIAGTSGRSTKVYRDDEGSVVVQYHGTKVVVIRSDDGVRLTSGGHMTATTKARMNQYLPHGWSLYAARGDWYLNYRISSREEGVIYAFEDGVTVWSDGRIQFANGTVRQSRRQRSATRTDTHRGVEPSGTPAGACVTCGQQTGYQWHDCSGHRTESFMDLVKARLNN